MTVYVVINSQDGEVLGVCMSEELALRTIVQFATDNNLDLSEIDSEKSTYDASYTYITIENLECMIIERELIEEN